MKWTIVVRGKFDAAHRLVGYPGACANVHGHTWVVEVGVEVDRLDDLGMGIDFKLVRGTLNDILKKFDHALLMKKGDGMFKGLPIRSVDFEMNPTAEMIAKAVYDEFKERGWENVKFVKVWESENAYVEYIE